jgi:hypothetical protein
LAKLFGGNNERRLKITGSPECPRNHGIQTADRLIFQCKRLRNETAILKSSVLKCPNEVPTE